MLLTEGLPLIMSLREAVVTAITQIRESASSSQQLPSSDIQKNLLESMDSGESEVTSTNVIVRKNEENKKSFYNYDVNRIENSNEL
jgi:hypothetical protein